MRAWRVALVLVLCLGMLVSCAPKSTLITTAAKDMNLTASEVGSGYALSEEQGLDKFVSSLDIGNIEEVSDANYRMFQNEAGGVVLSMAITLKKQATKSDLSDLVGGFEKGFTESMGEATLSEYKAPAVGDEASVRGVEFPDLGMSMFFLGFRKANVIGVLAVVGTNDYASEKIIGDLGQKLAAKIK